MHGSLMVVDGSATTHVLRPIRLPRARRSSV
jgi:hypothetical protein